MLAMLLSMIFPIKRQNFTSTKMRSPKANTKTQDLWKHTCRHNTKIIGFMEMIFFSFRTILLFSFYLFVYLFICEFFFTKKSYFTKSQILEIFLPFVIVGLLQIGRLSVLFETCYKSRQIDSFSFVYPYVIPWHASNGISSIINVINRYFTSSQFCYVTTTSNIIE